MINAIITGIFNLITFLFDKLFGTLFSGIIALFPSLAFYVNNIVSFLELAFTYVGLALKLMLIPSNFMQLLFSYFLIKYSIHVTMSVVRFALSVYNRLKI